MVPWKKTWGVQKEETQVVRLQAEKIDHLANSAPARDESCFSGQLRKLDEFYEREFN